MDNCLSLQRGHAGLASQALRARAGRQTALGLSESLVMINNLLGLMKAPAITLHSRREDPVMLRAAGQRSEGYAVCEQAWACLGIDGRHL